MNSKLNKDTNRCCPKESPNFRRDGDFTMVPVDKIWVHSLRWIYLLAFHTSAGCVASPNIVMISNVLHCICQVQDKGLQNKFAINEARTSQTHTILDPEMEKYENALNVKAFNDLQKRLKIPAEDVDALLPALMDARIKYETLSTAVETQSEVS